MSIILASQFPAIKASRWSRFLRTFAPWQLVRFLIVNVKMTLMIIKSHGGKNLPPAA